MRQRSDVKKRNNRRPSRGRECSDIEHRLAQCEATLASIPDGLLVLDKDWRCIYVNEVTAAFLKTAPEELIGKVIWEVCPASRYPQLHEEFMRAARQKASVRFEGFWESLGRWYECRCYPTDNGMTVLVRDTTSHKQAEEALRESEERYRTLFESSPDGIIFTDMEGQVLHTNPYFQEMLGYTPEELRALTYQQVTPRRWQEMEAAIVRDQVVTRGYSGAYEKEYIRKDGTVFPVSIQVWLIRDGRPQGMWGIVRDITERKRAEEALRMSEEKFRTLHALSPIAIVLNRLDNGQFLESNQALWDMTGYTEEEFRSLTYWDITPIDYQDMEAKRLELLHTAGRYGPYEKEYIRKDGTRFPVLLSGVRIQDPSGTDLIYSVIQDITELKAKDQAMRESREDLNRAQAVAHTGSWRLDIRHNVLLWSEETYRIFGLPQGIPMTYETFLAAVHPDDRQYVDQQWTAALRGQPYDIAHRIVVGDTVQWVRERAELEFDRDGALLGGFGTVQDITERKQAEEALRAKQAELELILHRTPFMLTRCSRDLHYRYVSRAYAEMIGRTPDQVAGKSILEIMGEEGFETIRPYVEAVLQGQPVGYEAPVPFREVGPRFLHVAYVPDEDEQGHVIGWIASIVDMSERKQAEEALRESEERFHRFFEEDLTADFISTPEGQILLCNPAFARIFGFSSALEAVGTNIVDLYLDPQERAPLLTRLKQQKKIERMEVWRKRRDGQQIYIVENLVGHFNEQGELDEIKGYLFDDTDRKQAAVALQESEEKYRTLFDSIDEGFCIIEMVFDDDGRPVDYRFLEINPAFERQTGLHDARGKSMRTLAPDHEAHWFETYGQIARTGAPARFTNEARALHRWYDVYAFRVGGQESRRVAILFNDITERRRTEEALRDLTRTLEDKVAQRTAELQHRARQLQKLTLELSETEDRERRQLAEILHDDLQQQLAAAKFHLSLLNSRAKHDPAQRAVVAQVDQMLMEAIQKSRNLSHELSPAVLYHADLAGALGWLAGQLHAKHGLEVAVDVFGEVGVQSDALKTFLYKSAQELLFNVVKHARVNQARIRVRRLGRCICLSVSDRGRGFDPLELRQTAGFGLLSIRERIELLGGRMKIHSVKGSGTTFHIVVPDSPMIEDGYPAVGAGPHARPTAEAGPGDRGLGGHGGPPLRVLLADDHEIVREGLRSLLSDEPDVQVVGEAANGREAVDLAYRLQPDVVIMDVAMPLINGDDATRQIKMHLPQTRVIALSMYEEPDLVEKMRRAGAEGYILKTAPSGELLAAIRGKAHAGVTA